MKAKFSTVDVFAAVSELQRTAVGMRLVNAYDVDNKTYLLKLQRPESKCVILFESGVRLHLTECDWPKSIHPSQFSMKLRKHLKQMHLDYVKVLGVDRVVDLCFNRSTTSTDNAFHIIVELYDRGNVLLTDANYNIMNILRRRTDKETHTTVAVGQRYLVENVRQECSVPSSEALQQYLTGGKPGDNLRRILVPKTLYGPALLEHCFTLCGIDPNAKLRDFDATKSMDTLLAALRMAQDIFEQIKSGTFPGKCGCILFKREKSVPMTSSELVDGEGNDTAFLDLYQEYHPVFWHQLELQTTKQTTDHNDSKSYQMCVKQFETFSAAVDEFYAEKTTQKMQHKAHQQQNDALKKLDNIRKDHEQRVAALEEAQTANMRKAQLIELNRNVVDKAIDILRRAIADQLDWNQIEELVQDATDRGDQIVSLIVKLNLEQGQFSMCLADPYEQFDSDGSGYYTHKRQAAEKEFKTLAASKKALKSAQAKTNDMLKQVQVRTAVSKKRKVLWFEKFLWFISSDGDLVLGGRDAQQNEVLVKRYFAPGDAYVHADLRGAASVIVKNSRAGSQSTNVISPRTLSEAGALAVCCSNAWDAKVTAAAWWVAHEQVSRTAPSGEYLTPGSFMVRGKKNFLAPTQLIMGFGFVFRLDEESTQRRIAAKIERQQSLASEPMPVDEDPQHGDEQAEEIELSDSDSDGDRVGQGANVEKEEFPDVAGLSLQRLTASSDGVQNDQQTSADDYSILQLGPWRPDRRDRNPGNKQTPRNTVGGADATDREHSAYVKGTEAKRGQKHKNKKMKNKYKDQDEEERQLRLELLGSMGTQAKSQSNTKKGKKYAGQNEKRKNAPTNREEVQTKPTESKSSELTEDNPSDAIETVNDKIETAYVLEEKPVQAASEDHEEVPDKDEDAAGADESTPSDDVAVLSSLTAKAEPDDVLLYALPVCAPYSAMSNFKYKVKLTPGQGKRGKAAKLALQLFIKHASHQGPGVPPGRSQAAHRCW